MKKRSARDAYKEKGRYVDEEIMRMQENENYLSEVMVRYEKQASKADAQTRHHGALPFINISSNPHDPDLRTGIVTERFRKDSEMLHLEPIGP